MTITDHLSRPMILQSLTVLTFIFPMFLRSVPQANTVVSQESVHLDISPPLDSASVTQDFGESSCSVVQHGESNNSCEADNLDLCIQPDIVLDVPCSSEIASIGFHTAVCLPATLSCDVLESSNSQHFVVPSHVVKLIHSSVNFSLVSLFCHCSLWFLIISVLVIYVVFLKRITLQ